MEQFMYFSLGIMCLSIAIRIWCVVQINWQFPENINITIMNHE